MKIEQTEIAGVYIITPQVFEDKRGYFMETFNTKSTAHIISEEFVQDNESLSQKGVLRGLHFQNPPFAQAKLVRVIKGSVLDVAVDLRKNSNTFGKHVVVKLSKKNKKQLYVPKGFAHGFITLEDDTIFSYKCSAFYHKEAEISLLWSDKTLAIDWQIENPIISKKDKQGLAFNSFESPF